MKNESYPILEYFKTVSQNQDFKTLTTDERTAFFENYFNTTIVPQLKARNAPDEVVSGVKTALYRDFSKVAYMSDSERFFGGIKDIFLGLPGRFTENLAKMAMIGGTVVGAAEAGVPVSDESVLETVKSVEHKISETFKYAHTYNPDAEKYVDVTAVGAIIGAVMGPAMLPTVVPAGLMRVTGLAETLAGEAALAEGFSGAVGALTTELALDKVISPVIDEVGTKYGWDEGTKDTAKIVSSFAASFGSAMTIEAKLSKLANSPLFRDYTAFTHNKYLKLLSENPFLTKEEALMASVFQNPDEGMGVLIKTLKDENPDATILKQQLLNLAEAKGFGAGDVKFLSSLDDDSIREISRQVVSRIDEYAAARARQAKEALEKSAKDLNAKVENLENPSSTSPIETVGKRLGLEHGEAPGKTEYSSVYGEMEAPRFSYSYTIDGTIVVTPSDGFSELDEMALALGGFRKGREGYYTSKATPAAQQAVTQTVSQTSPYHAKAGILWFKENAPEKLTSLQKAYAEAGSGIDKLPALIQEHLGIKSFDEFTQQMHTFLTDGAEAFYDEVTKSLVRAHLGAKGKYYVANTAQGNLGIFWQFAQKSSPEIDAVFDVLNKVFGISRTPRGDWIVLPRDLKKFEKLATALGDKTMAPSEVAARVAEFSWKLTNAPKEFFEDYLKMLANVKEVSTFGELFSAVAKAGSDMRVAEKLAADAVAGKEPSELYKAVSEVRETLAEKVKKAKEEQVKQKAQKAEESKKQREEKTSLNKLTAVSQKLDKELQTASNAFQSAEAKTGEAGGTEIDLGSRQLAVDVDLASVLGQDNIPLAEGMVDDGFGTVDAGFLTKFGQTAEKVEQKVGQAVEQEVPSVPKVSDAGEAPKTGGSEKPQVRLAEDGLPIIPGISSGDVEKTPGRIFRPLLPDRLTNKIAYYYTKTEQASSPFDVFVYSETGQTVPFMMDSPQVFVPLGADSNEEVLRKLREAIQAQKRAANGEPIRVRFSESINAELFGRGSKFMDEFEKVIQQETGSPSIRTREASGFPPDEDELLKDASAQFRKGKDKKLQHGDMWVSKQDLDTHIPGATKLLDKLIPAEDRMLLNGYTNREIIAAINKAYERGGFTETELGILEQAGAVARRRTLECRKRVGLDDWEDSVRRALGGFFGNSETAGKAISDIVETLKSFKNAPNFVVDPNRATRGFFDLLTRTVHLQDALDIFHEVGHWLWWDVLSAEDRIAFAMQVGRNAAERFAEYVNAAMMTYKVPAELRDKLYAVSSYGTKAYANALKNSLKELENDGLMEFVNRVLEVPVTLETKKRTFFKEYVTQVSMLMQDFVQKPENVTSLSKAFEVLTSIKSAGQAELEQLKTALHTVLVHVLNETENANVVSDGVRKVLQLAHEVVANPAIAEVIEKSGDVNLLRLQVSMKILDGAVSTASDTATIVRNLRGENLPLGASPSPLSFLDSSKRQYLTTPAKFRIIPQVISGLLGFEVDSEDGIPTPFGFSLNWSFDRWAELGLPVSLLALGKDLGLGTRAKLLALKSLQTLPKSEYDELAKAFASADRLSKHPALRKLYPQEGLPEDVWKMRRQMLNEEGRVKRQLREAAQKVNNLLPGSLSQEIVGRLLQKGVGYDQFTGAAKQAVGVIMEVKEMIKKELLDAGFGEDALRFFDKNPLPEIRSVFKSWFLDHDGPIQEARRTMWKSLYSEFLLPAGKNRVFRVDDAELLVLKKKFPATRLEVGKEFWEVPTPDGRTEFVPVAVKKNGAEGWRKWSLASIEASGGKYRFVSEYTDEERAALGISSEVYSSLVRLTDQAGRLLAIAKFYKEAAQSPRVFDPETITNVIEKAKKVQQLREEGWTYIPKEKLPNGMNKYGLLSGKWVDPEIRYVLDNMTYKKPMNPFLEAISSAYANGIGIWKIGKVAYQISTMVTNIVGSMSASVLGGYNPFELMYRGLKVLAEGEKNPFFREGLDNGLTTSSLLMGEKEIARWKLFFASRHKETEQELLRQFDDVLGHSLVDVFTKETFKHGLKDNAKKLLYNAGVVAKLPIEAYEKCDQVFKMGVFSKLREEQKTIEEAVKEAQKLFFDYRDTPAAYKWMGKYGVIPFASFLYNWTRLLSKTAVENPHRLFGLLGTIGLISDAMWASTIGSDWKEVKKAQEKLEPEWMGKKLANIVPAKFPVGVKKSASGGIVIEFLHFPNVFPGGLFFSPEETFTGFPFSQNPILALLYGFVSGKDAAFQREIYEPVKRKGAFSEDREVVKGMLEYASRVLLPNIPGIPGQFSTQRFGQALTNAGVIKPELANELGFTGKNYFGDPVSIERELFNYVSPFRIREFYFDVEAKSFMENTKRARSEEKSQLRRLFRNPSVSEKQKIAAVEVYKNKTQQAAQQLGEFMQTYSKARRALSQALKEKQRGE